MCLICVEFNKKRMTKEELKRALPEMINFAKTEEEKNHYKKLQALDRESDLIEETENYLRTINNAKK